MTEETITTIKVYESDSSLLKRLFGAPQWRAFRLALKACAHPEDDRTYLAAEVPGEGNDCLREGSNQTVNGFYCATCNQYIFPKRN
jgi:hypothetical protein